jgi:tetratricopeptide (TPR) repeat protein
VAAGSGGGSGRYVASMPSEVAQPPKQIAAGHYKSGLRYKKRAWKQEEKAAKASTPEKREKLLAKAAKNYDRARDEYFAVLRNDRMHHEAANELGYAWRKIGRYKQAIRWYNRALELKPGFLEAIEYRGEAYLAIGDIDAAKGAYMELFRNDQPLADQLLVAMEAWLSQQADGSVESAEIGGFSEWLTERRELAAITRDVSFIESRQW